MIHKGIEQVHCGLPLRHRQAERQADRKGGRVKGRYVNRQTDRRVYRQADRYTVSEINRQNIWLTCDMTIN